MLQHYLSYEERTRDGLEQDIYSKFQCSDRRSSASSTASTASNESNPGGMRNKLGFCQMSRQLLANKFQKNWTKQCSNESGFDDSLTNLNWLHNVNPIKINEQLTSAPVGYPRDKLSMNNYQPRNHYSITNPNHLLSTNIDPSFLFHSSDNHSFDNPDYKNNPNLKPPFPYAVLISWAMKELGKPKITLSDIYGWIVENFAYYRYSDSSWQNSVRHNLSLGKCFEKVPRRKDEPGKGGFWRINPEHLKTLDVNLSKIKYNPLSYPPVVGYKPEKQPVVSSYGHVNDLNAMPENPKPITINPTPVKRSRKSPIRATPENWDSVECFNKKLNHQTSHFEIDDDRGSPYEELIFTDGQSTFNSKGIEFSSIDNSSCDSNPYLTKCSSDSVDISISNFDADSLGDILTSPMLLDREEIIDHDEYKSMAFTNDFSDFFPTSKDDLQELNSLLGIY